MDSELDLMEVIKSSNMEMVLLPLSGYALLVMTSKPEPLLQAKQASWLGDDCDNETRD